MEAQYSHIVWSNRLSEPVYSSRIIKASALIADTKILLAEWDLSLSVEENMNLARQENIFGKTSRKRVENILNIFRQRYWDDPEVGATLVKMIQDAAPTQWVDPLLYFFSAQNDRTLRDAVTEILYPRHQMGYIDVPTDVFQRGIRSWVAEEKTTTAWNDETIERVAQGIAATLRDFGVLEGAVNKRLSPFLLPNHAFALIAFWLHQREKNGQLTLHSDDWKLFFLPVDGVERFFIEAHQMHLLTYHAAGSIIRIEFPATTLSEYAHVLLERTH